MRGPSPRNKEADTSPTPEWTDLYDPAKHTDDGHGGCVICLFGVPYTDDTVERVRWPCAVVREARSTSSEPLDVPRLVQALRHLGFHEMDADEGRYLHPESAGSAIAAEYARLSHNEEAETLSPSQ